MSTLSDSYKNKNGKYPLKLIHCGLHRAGTTSVAKALDILGFGPVWHPALNKTSDNNKYLKWWNDNHIIDKLENNEFIDFDEWFNMIQCQTVMDAPSSLYWELFMNYYPNSKIILTIREFDGWYNSNKFIFKVLKSNLMKLLYKFGNAPFLDWMINKYIPKLEEIWPILDVDKNTARQKYIESIENIKSKCDADRLLIFDVKTGWKPLCEFLNVSIPKNIKFPHKNSEDSVKRKIVTGLIESILFSKWILAITFVTIFLIVVILVL